MPRFPCRTVARIKRKLLKFLIACGRGQRPFGLAQPSSACALSPCGSAGLRASKNKNYGQLQQDQLLQRKNPGRLFRLFRVGRDVRPTEGFGVPF